MAANPIFSYFLAHNSRAVGKADSMWETPLPMHRTGPAEAGIPPITYGNYFLAIRRVLEKNNFELLAVACARQTKTALAPDKINTVDIVSEKHGLFYHPARVCVSAAGAIATFALTVAVSDAGRNLIETEFLNLKKLQRDFAYDHLPEAYALGSHSDETEKPKIAVFIGQWFDGYSEFHLSFDRKSGTNRIHVWDAHAKHPFLNDAETKALYSEIAMILTGYYNIETFFQIFPWHHGAGDFILKRDPNGPDVKLITVRQYAAMLEAPHKNQTPTPDADTLMWALLLFLLNLAIRTRLDRLDGVGDVVWAKDLALVGTVEGFFRALGDKRPPTTLSESLPLAFRAYLSTFHVSDLYDITQDIVAAYHPKAPELPVIKSNLKAHTLTLFRALAN